MSLALPCFLQNAESEFSILHKEETTQVEASSVIDGHFVLIIQPSMSIGQITTTRFTLILLPLFFL